MDDDWKIKPHDALFRRALESLDDARTALEAAMPEALAAAVDFDRLTMLPARIVDSVLRAGESDALFELPIRGTNRSIVIFVPVEHQSQPDDEMPLRLLRVSVTLWERQRRDGVPLSPVIPLVISHGRAWNAPASMLAMLDLPENVAALVGAYTPRNTYVLDDLARYDPASLARRPTLSAKMRVTYFLLQRARTSPALEDELPRVAADLAFLAATTGAIGTLVAFARYTLVVANADPQAFRRALRQAIGEDMEEIVMGTLAEQLLARGRVEGEARGRVEGEARGRVEVLTRLLELRFGAIDARTTEVLKAASVEAVDGFTERLLTAKTLDDVFDDA